MKYTGSDVNNGLLPKPAWGPGPWQAEPDRVEWTHAALPCLAS